MNTLLDNDIIQHWEREEEMFQSEMKDEAEKDAVTLANLPDFSAHLRDEVSKLSLDDFRKPGDLGLRTKLVVEHPTFGITLRSLLDEHGLLDMDADYLSDAAEVFVITLFNVLWRHLAEFETWCRKS